MTTASHEDTSTSSSKEAAVDLHRLPAFKEHPDTGYRGRTLANAGADLTIAIASNMDTAGERLTKKAVLEQGKIYCPIQYRGQAATDAAACAIRKAIRSIDKPEISINVAGNGLYTLNEKWSVEQEDVDRYTFELLRAVVKDTGDKKISLIRSGGQTGFDEAGVKAGMSLGIPTEVLAPKGWKMRDAAGVDLADAASFKRRFVLHQLKLEYLERSYAWQTYCYDLDDECAGWETFGFKRNEAGLLVMEHLTEEQERELGVNVHAYFNYELVMLDVKGCVGYRRMFKNLFYTMEALEDFEEKALGVTRKLIQ